MTQRRILDARGIKARRGIANPEEWRSVDMEDAPLTHLDEASDEQPPSYIGGAGKIRQLQALSEVNGSIGGEKGWVERIEEIPEMAKKRKQG